MRPEPGTRLGRPSTSGALALTAMLVALVALVLSMGNPSSTAAPGRGSSDEVRLLTTVTGQVETLANWEQVPVPVDGATFTQEAGTTILLVTHVTADFDPTDGNDCDITVAWMVPELESPGGFPDTIAHALGQSLGRHVFAITPAAADRTLTLDVATSSDGVCQNGTGGTPSYRVGVEVAVLALR